MLEKIGESLNVDRCFFYVYVIHLKNVVKLHLVWRRNDSIAGDYFQKKSIEESSFVDDDPLYRAALVC